MVFVTGGTGFLGSYIIKELIEKGHKVRALRRSNKLPFYISQEIFTQVDWVEGDVLDIVALEDALQGVDTVIHSAAKVSFAVNERNEMYKVNVEGTANMINAAINCNISHFIHVSSVAALGRKATGVVVNEEKKWEESKVNTHYAISKYKAEMEAWRGFAEGLPLVIVNPSTILGYGDWNSSSCAIFRNTYKEFPWYTSGVNGFVDVEDVARAIVLLVEKKITGERFILNSDNWSFQKLLTTIAEGFRKKHPYRHATPFMGNIAWRLEKLKSMLTGKPGLLSRESARVAQSRTFFENGKILKFLPGFSFTPLNETIAKACEKYLARLQPL